MGKREQIKRNENDLKLRKLVVTNLKSGRRKEKTTLPNSLNGSKLVYKQRDPLDPSVPKQSRKKKSEISAKEIIIDVDVPGLASLELGTILKNVQEECNLTKEMENLELLHTETIEVNKQHAKRMGQISKDWEDNLNLAMKALIESYATVPTSCCMCKKMVKCNYIRCSNCVKVYCSYCDIDFHTSTTLHNRDVMQNLNVIQLKAKEFWDTSNNAVIVKGINFTTNNYFILTH